MGYWARIAAAIVVAACSPSLQAESLRVLYAEPFEPQTSASDVSQKPGAASRLKLRAFGRDFQLDLEDNGRLVRNLAATERASIAVFKGAVSNVPGSWVRLVRIDGRYEGAFWDGADLYAIGTTAAVSAASLTPLEPRAASAIYRLSDTQGGLLTGTCGLDAGEGAAPAPLERYRALVQELRQSVQAKPDATHEISVAMIGDYEFAARSGNAAVASLVSRANVADGIFSTQVGVSIVPTDFVLYTSDTDPFTSSEPATLLGQLGDFRSSTSPIRERGLAHLVTGRELNGNIIGIAYFDGACDARAGASLSESSAFIDSALIMAHEIGHSLGARHDGEQGSACSTTPTTYLMAPNLNYNPTLSACSVQSIKTAIAAASCVVPLRSRDTEVTTPTPSIDAIVNRTFTFDADIRALGSYDALNVAATVQFSGTMSPQSASISGGTCSVSYSDVTCSLSQLPAGETRRLSVTVLPRDASEYSATVRVSSLNDTNAANDSRTVAIKVSSERDFQLVVGPQPMNAVLGEPFDMTFDVRSSGPLGLGDVRATIDLMTKNIASATADSGTCTVNAQISSVTCALGAIASGGTRRITVRMTSTQPGSWYHGVQVSDQSLSPAFWKSRSFTIQTQVARDLSAEFTPIARRIAIGVPSTWAVAVKSNGVYAVSGAKVRIEPPSYMPPAHLTYPSTCVAIGSDVECTLGTVAPGALVTIPIGLRMDQAAEGSMLVRLVQTASDDMPWNDSTSSFLAVVPAREAMLSASGSVQALDGQEASLFASIFSQGAEAIADATASITLPAGFEIRSATIGATQCVVQSGMSNLASCAVPTIEGGERGDVLVRFVAPQPGQFTGTIAISAPGDADATNNSATVGLEVKPYVDGRIAVVTPAALNLTAQPLTIAFTAATNRHVFSDGFFSFDWYGGVADVSASWPGGSCESSTTPLRCDLGDVPANSSVPITVTVRAKSAGYFSVRTSLYSSAESNQVDNSVYFSFSMFAPVDIALVLDQTQATVTAGQQLRIPGIKVSGDGSVNTFAEFDFDPTLFSQFAVAGASCTAARPMRCDLYVGNVSTQLAIDVRAKSAGSIPIRIRIGSFNDSNPSNNEGTITLNVAAVEAPPSPAPSAPTPTSGGGGGGGSFDWPLALVLLMCAGVRRRLAIRVVRL